MAKKTNGRKFWIYGEDEKLVAQFAQYMNVVLENCRIRYIDQLKRHLDYEESYEELQDKNQLPDTDSSFEEQMEARLMWNAIKNYLPFLAPRECETMICLYVHRMSVGETAEKMSVAPSTVSIYKKRAVAKICEKMEDTF